MQIIYYDESNYTDMYIATYDPATDAVSEGIKFSSTLTSGGYYNMVPGDGDILYYAGSNGLFSYKCADTGVEADHELYQFGSGCRQA